MTTTTERLAQALTVNQCRHGNLLVPIKQCASDNDGDCYHVQCPQLKDNEPSRTGRSCPLYDWTDWSA